MENTGLDIIPIIIYQSHGMNGMRQASEVEKRKISNAYHIMSISWNQWDEASFRRRNENIEAEALPIVRYQPPGTNVTRQVSDEE